MSLSTPAPFAVRLANIASRLGAALTADGVSKEVCLEVASGLDLLDKEVETGTRSLDEAGDARRTMEVAISSLQGGVDGVQAGPAAVVFADLSALAARLLGPPPRTLPLEIIYRIINCFGEDEVTWRDSTARARLAPLSLVHPSWTLEVQRRLFRETGVKSDNQVSELDRTLIINPRLASFIVEFSIEDLVDSCGSIRFLLPRFTSLRNLFVVGTAFCPAWIQDFPQLEELHLMDNTVLEPTPTSLPSYTSLTNLYIDMAVYPFDISTLDSFSSLVILTCCGLHDIDTGDHDKAVKLAVQNYSTLQVLSLDSDDIRDEMVFRPVLDALPTFSQLRCLCLTWEIPMEELILRLPSNLAYLQLVPNIDGRELLPELVLLLIDAMDQNLLPSTLKRIGITDYYHVDHDLEAAVRDGKVSADAARRLNERGLVVVLDENCWYGDELVVEYAISK